MLAPTHTTIHSKYLDTHTHTHTHTHTCRLLDTLGSGQFGMVHKGTWVRKLGEKKREVSTEVAVKTMRDGATEEDTIKFLQEAAIMGQFKQPNILRIQGIIMEGDSVSLG